MRAFSENFGEGGALDPMLSPPLASLDPPEGRVMKSATQYSTSNYSTLPKGG